MRSEISVFCAGAMKGMVAPVARQFEREGDGVCLVRLRFGAAGVLKAAVLAGEDVDLLVLPRPVLDQLADAGKVASESLADLARVGVGVAIPEGAPNLEVSTLSSLREALRNARAIAYANPATGDSSGLHVASVIDRLGLADEVRAKCVLAELGLAVATLVQQGTVELGITQASIIQVCPGVKLAGLLPSELQKTTTYCVGVSRTARPNPGVRALAAALGKLSLEDWA